MGGSLLILGNIDKKMAARGNYVKRNFTDAMLSHTRLTSVVSKYFRFIVVYFYCNLYTFKDFHIIEIYSSYCPNPLWCSSN